MIAASSSSCLCASMIADGLKHRENMLVAHPVSSGIVFYQSNLDLLLADDMIAASSSS